jgi:hypothetical protein
MASEDELYLLGEMILKTDQNNERRHLAALAAFTKAANLENQVLVHKAHNFGLAPTHGPDGKPIRRLHFIDPANTELVLALHAGSWKDRADFTYTSRCWSISPHQPLLFHGTFADRHEYKVFCSTPPEVLRAYPRGNALVSLLCDRTFAGVEAFAVAVENALGEDVTTVLLDGKINKPFES